MLNTSHPLQSFYLPLLGSIPAEWNGRAVTHRMEWEEVTHAVPSLPAEQVTTLHSRTWGRFGGGSVAGADVQCYSVTGMHYTNGGVMRALHFHCSQPPGTLPTPLMIFPVMSATWNSSMRLLELSTSSMAVSKVPMEGLMSAIFSSNSSLSCMASMRMGYL